MENVIGVNPQAIKVNYSVQVMAKDLYVLGWDFESSIQNVMDTQGIPYNYAKIRILSRSVRLYFETNQEGQIAFFWYFAIDEAVRNDTGFVNLPIEDLLTLVNNGLYVLNSIVDYSTDEEGNYCSFLVII